MTNTLDSMSLHSRIGGRVVRCGLALLLTAPVGWAQAVTYFQASLDGSQETPPATTTASGSATFVLDSNAHTLRYYVAFAGLTGTETAAHIHGFAPPGTAAPVIFPLPLGSPKVGTVTTTPDQENQIRANLAYVNVHTDVFPSGEIRGQLILTPTPPPVNYCFGDGAGTPCPCGNNSSVGEDAGCVNSFILASRLRASGISSISTDTLVLDGSRLPPSTPVLFFQGTTTVNNGVGSAFGDGLRCAGGVITRIAVVNASSGLASYPAPGQMSVSQRASVSTVGTLEYQSWYRNTGTFCVAEQFNTTNGVEVVWVP